MILGDLKKNIFSNPKGGAFGFAKMVFAVRGGNLSDPPSIIMISHLRQYANHGNLIGSPAQRSYETVG